jgi:hypothetical protein
MAAKIKRVSGKDFFRNGMGRHAEQPNDRHRPIQKALQHIFPALPRAPFRIDAATTVYCLLKLLMPFIHGKTVMAIKNRQRGKNKPVLRHVTQNPRAYTGCAMGTKPF